MRLFLLLLFFPFLSFGQITIVATTTNNRVTPSDEPFSNVVTSQSGEVISVTLDWLTLNQNIPPSFETVVVTGTALKTETLTATANTFYSPGGYPQGTTTYQWYRADNIQSVGSAIGGATSSTYILADADVAKYIRCVATPVQTGGINTTGTGVTSIYTSQVQDNVFNPLTDITWFTAHTPAGATDLATNEYWTNYGTGNNSTRNSTDAFPTYSSSDGGYVDFESSNNEELVLDQPGTQFTMPVEVWLRVKFESFNASWAYILDWNGSQRVEQRTSGAIYLSNASCSYTPTTGNWVVMRFVISGTSNTSKFNANNGTELTNIAASTAAFGTSNGRIGSNSSGSSNRYDGFISHIFIRQGELSSGEVSDMWTWFSTNAPWD